MEPIQALLPRGYPEPRATGKRGNKEEHRVLRSFTVLYDPLGLFSKGAVFGYQHVKHKQWGMVAFGCFADGTRLQRHDGVEFVVRENTLCEET